MAILYNLKKEKDKFILNVEQDTIYTLYYLSYNTETKLSTVSILADTDTVIPHTVDGEYKIKLEVESELSVEVTFVAFNNLQNSIIREARGIVCGEDCGCNDGKANCLTKAGRKCLEHKSTFVKLLSFENLFIPSYGVDYPLIFTNFLNTSTQAATCKIQSKINDILTEECVTGSVEDTDKLFAFNVALYWAGMYFIEEDLAGTDEEQLAFVKEKFYYDTIIKCLCGFCIDINVLKENYGKDMVYTEINSFQFDGIGYDINDVDIITPEWLETNGTVETETSLLSGKNITYTLLGRVGFTITNNKDKYRFYDALGNDITDSVFDNVWDDTAKRQTYVSKEYYVPSVIYYKFVKI